MAYRMTTYFGYGSNLDESQMRRRCPGATIVGPAMLENHQLAFRGFSVRWGGSVATVRRCAGTRVHGLVYALTPADVDALDRCEGAPAVYERVTRLVRCEDGRRRRVQTYVMVGRASKLVTRPGPVYVARIWIAYVRLGFDRAPLNRALGGAQ
jgi:cation transport regulator ChaC